MSADLGVRLLCASGKHTVRFARRGRGISPGPLALLALMLVIAVSLRARAAPPDLTELSIEELMNVEVTTVSRKPERLAAVADAIYVLSNEEIRRSGVTSLPEALRLVPGVQVARIDSNKWAIGVRGFASRLARSVLVLIDGRTVYNTLFAGTYWEVQDILLEDVDRIEVIRGPGGALWGANAFNGVINIITKDAADTQGGLLTGGGGSEERGFGAARYGGAIGKDLHYRAYGKYFNRDAGASSGPGAYDDSWWMARGGFRVDWRPQTDDWFTLQGDLYEGELGNRVVVARFDPPFAAVLKDDSDASGGNVLGRWTRTLSPTSELSVQLYYDHAFRRDPHFRDERDTVDFDSQHRFDLPGRQEIVWGLGYRLTADNTGGLPGIAFVPPSTTDHLYTGFVQDEIRILPDRIHLTIGTKLEHNDYTGFEYQPNLRLLLMPLAAHTFWGSVGRAVRTPSRVEEDADLTVGPLNIDPTDPNQCLAPDGTPTPCTYARIVGNPDFASEELLAGQIGWRAQLFSRLFVDTLTFYHDYNCLLSAEPGTPFVESAPPPPHNVVPFALENQLGGRSYGFTIAADTYLTEWWRVQAWYSYVQIELETDASSRDVSSEAQEGSTPHNQVNFFSQVDLPGDVDFDTVFRYVDNLPAQRIRSYVTFDVRVAVQVTSNLEVAAVGQNLWDTDHREFAGGTELQRGAYGQVRWQW